MDDKHAFNTQDLDDLVRQRLEVTRPQRSQTRQAIYRQKPLLAEPDKPRARRYAERKLTLTGAAGVARAAAHHELSLAGAESLQGDTVDYLPSWFLAAGARCGRAVALLSMNGNPQGTGFLITPSLLITNNHVLGSPGEASSFTAEFNFEVDEKNANQETTSFALDADKFWLTHPIDELDYTVIALGPRLSGRLSVAELGFLPLSRRADKHALGICVNLIQHPQGHRKQVVVRENRLLARGGGDLELAKLAVHYSADTEPGSSGSPVCNDQWEVVALHHWGAPHLDVVTIDGVKIPQTVNEGIRVSAIVAQLESELPSLAPAQQALLRQVLASDQEGGPPEPVAERVQDKARPIADLQPATVVVPGETVHVLQVPLEIRVRVAAPGNSVTAAPQPRLAGLGAYAERIRVDPNYANRNGFNEAFIDGITVSLKRLVGPWVDDVAPLTNGTAGVNAVLDYQNFSLMLSRSRRLAFFTATNIDGDSYVPIDRDTGLPPVGPEGESWVDDPRVARDYVTGQAFYSDWSTYFDRGHLTRRTDPIWGTEAEAIRANADTFHRTNCSPQHFRFNQSIRYWQGVERHILEYGVLRSKNKVTVLTGPVLNERAKDYGGLLVPLQYWKVIVRTGLSGKVEVTALLVSQEKLLPEKRRPLGQADQDQVPQLDQYLVALPMLESLTKLDFGDLKRFDTYRAPAAEEGAEASPFRAITGWEDLL